MNKKGSSVILFAMIVSLLLLFFMLFGTNDNEESENVINDIKQECVAGSTAWSLTLKLNHSINTPDLLNCSQLAWIIENSAYPSGYMEWHYVYNNNSCHGRDGDLAQVNRDPHIKGNYDDYYFRNCLTKLSSYSEEKK